SHVGELPEAIAITQECRDLPLQEEPYRSALQMAEFLDGFPRYPKMHPCGLVLSRQPINQLVPTFTSAKGYPTTHFNMDSVEALQPWTDSRVWDLIANGHARAVHHIESHAMISLCKMCNVRDIDGLIAIVSVIRPGAANENKKMEFTRRYQSLHRSPALPNR